MFSLTGVQHCASSKLLRPLKAPHIPICKLLDWNLGDQKSLLYCTDSRTSTQSICFSAYSTCTAIFWDKECFTTCIYLSISGPKEALSLMYFSV